MKISRFFAAMLAAAALSGALSANASTITYDKRGITDFTFLGTHDYQLGWTQQSSPVSASTLNDFFGQVPGDNNFTRLAVDFNVGSPKNVIFQLGIDAGYGSELRLDGNLLTRNANDMWWNLDWGNSAGILNGSSPVLGSGHHLLEGFWAENCCSGWQAGRFSVDNGAHWQNLDIGNLDTLAAVPEPGMLAVFGIGFAALGLRRRKEEAASKAA